MIGNFYIYFKPLLSGSLKPYNNNKTLFKMSAAISDWHSLSPSSAAVCEIREHKNVYSYMIYSGTCCGLTLQHVFKSS